MKSENEIWKDIPHFENYEVSTFGRVRSKNYRKTGVSKILISSLGKSGYYTVDLCKNGVSKKVKVHRLVALSFIDYKGDKVVNHINGIKTDNRAKNLEWVSQKQNVLHIYKNKLKSSVKLTVEDVINIRRELVDGVKQKDLSVKYNVCNQHISDIKHRKTWKFVM